MRGSPEIKTYGTEYNKGKQGITIVGNMKVGKTSLFSRICGKATASIKIPGNTVSINAGRIKGTNMYAFDTPGVFSIFSSNEDARASRDILLPHKTDYDIHGIILMADAKHMKRSIAIALQYAEYGLPMLLNINMIDEATSRGIEIDYDKLTEILGIDVCTTIAREGIGVQKVIANLADMRTVKNLTKYPDWIEQFLEIVSKLLKTDDISPRAIGLLLLTGDSGLRNGSKVNSARGCWSNSRTCPQNTAKRSRRRAEFFLQTCTIKKPNRLLMRFKRQNRPPKVLSL